MFRENVNYAELSKIKIKGLEIYELISSGMTHINEAYGKAHNSFRVGEPFIDLNFGIVEVNWRELTVKLSVLGIDGARAITFLTSIK